LDHLFAVRMIKKVVRNALRARRVRRNDETHAETTVTSTARNARKTKSLILVPRLLPLCRKRSNICKE
jgi:hypothetical protein